MSVVLKPQLLKAQFCKTNREAGMRAWAVPESWATADCCPCCPHPAAGPARCGATSLAPTPHRWVAGAGWSQLCLLAPQARSIFSCPSATPHLLLGRTLLTAGHVQILQGGRLSVYQHPHFSSFSLHPSHFLCPFVLPRTSVCSMRRTTPSTSASPAAARSACSTSMRVRGLAACCDQAC